MARFLRVFVCKRCAQQSSIEELTSFMSVVECRTCDVAEVLSHEDVLSALDHFDFFDVPELKVAGWRN
jgi:transcription elongation factor Elf1